ncbi:MAG: tetratricopeptide repeat protein [Burkholderiales bacterium]
MSVINQLLLDLERRRAGPAERAALPSHVRALPEDKEIDWGWVAGGAAVACAAIASGWLVFAAYEPGSAMPLLPAPRSGAETTIERVVSASAGVAGPSETQERIESLLLEPPAARMTFELSSVPAETGSVALDPPRATASQTPVTVRAEAVLSAGSDAARPAKKAAAATTGRPEIRKRDRPPTAQELADNEYRQASGLLQQGRLAEAQAGFQAALTFLPEHHGARQGLVGLLLKAGQFAEAERSLQDGIRLSPEQSGFTVTLARLQVDRGDNAQAITTMQDGLRYAQGNPDYAAFLAALLQRQGRHEEAAEQFRSALRAKPAVGVWWIGLGMSLQALNRNAEAQDAYRRARANGNLHPELGAFAEQRLKQLQ